MALVNPMYFMKKAQQQGVAIASFNVHNLETIQAVVEGELGRIGGAEDNLAVDAAEAAFTVLSEARAFAEQTGIDMLAVAIGTAHGEYRGEPRLVLKGCQQFVSLWTSRLFCTVLPVFRMFKSQKV